MEQNKDVISLRVPSKKTPGMKYVTRQKLQTWLIDYKCWINENVGEDIWDDPSRIINMDETSVAMDGDDGRVIRIIARKGERYTFRENKGKHFTTFYIQIDMFYIFVHVPMLCSHVHLQSPPLLTFQVHFPTSWQTGTLKRETELNEM